VIDKDLTAVLLAEGLGADRLIMLTYVPYVVCDWWRAAIPLILRRLDEALQASVEQNTHLPTQLANKQTRRPPVSPHSPVHQSPPNRFDPNCAPCC